MSNSREIGYCSMFRCGARIYEGDAFCQKCGVPVSQAISQPQPNVNKNMNQKYVTCSCGVNIIDGDAFCQTCGARAPEGGLPTQASTPTHTIVYVEPPKAFAAGLPEWSIEPPPAAVVKRVARN
jgi:uncharacterized membrane protein YvbJ